MSPDHATPTELEEAKPAEEVTEKKSMKERLAFMGKGGEKMDKVPVINKVPRSMRVLFVILIVVVLVVAIVAVGMLMGGDDAPDGGPKKIDPAKLEDFTWSSGPLTGSASEFQTVQMPFDSMLTANDTILVDSISMSLEWQDEPDQTWAGRTRENSADSFQLRIDLGHGNYTVESEMTPNDEGSKQGSVSLTFNVGMTNYTYVLVGSDTEGLDLPANVTDMGVDLAVIMGEAGDLYASGPALFKLNDFGNDYMLTVTVAGKIIP